MALMKSDKLILFPATIDHYQVQIIHYLESERYEDALSLLQYLQQFTVDDQTSREWQLLINWLRGSMVEESPLFEADEWTEEQIRKSIFEDKIRQEQEYTKKLLDTLTQTTRIEKQLLALEQLVVIEHPEIGGRIMDWLESKTIHPHVQFKALQLLRSKGIQRVISLRRNGKTLPISCEQTPLQFSQFPLTIRKVLNKVIEASERSYVSIGFFAEEMWYDFVTAIYATDYYVQLVNASEEQIATWAAVLHHQVLESLNINVDYDELRSIYGIEVATCANWQKSYLMMKNFAKT